MVRYDPQYPRLPGDPPRKTNPRLIPNPPKYTGTDTVQWLAVYKDYLLKIERPFVLSHLMVFFERSTYRKMHEVQRICERRAQEMGMRRPHYLEFEICMLEVFGE